MIDSLFFVIVIGVFGFIATFASIPVYRKFALKCNFLSYPGGRRIHEAPTPLLGGAAIYLPFAVVFCFLYVLTLLGRFELSEKHKFQMIALFLGTTWIFFLGTIDDKVSISWEKKILGQLFAVGILIVGGHSINVASIPFWGPVQFGFLGIPLFAIIILIITNAINLIDGLDGLAGGVCFFAALTSGIIGFVKGDYFVATIGFTLSGSLLGFLFYNFPPASIYMGDGGSLMLGFLLGTLATSCAALFPGQRSGTMGMIILPFLPFGIALLDVFLAVLRRWISGRKIFLADSDHLHHRLMEKFRHPRRVVAIFYSFSALLSAMTLFVILGPGSEISGEMIILSGTVLVAVVVALLRLYRIENLPQALENRPHFQFLSSYQTFMSRRIRRATTFDELISLLESGVRDLGFDQVEVLKDGYVLKKWFNSRRVHDENPKNHFERKYEQWGIIIRWVIPTHKSKTYQKTLELTWYRFIRELESRIESFYLEELGMLNTGIGLSSRTGKQTF